VDPGNETLQAFSTNGECLAIFSVAEITAACFLDESLLAVSCSRGVELYKINGRLICTIPLSPAVAIARYKDGYVAAHQNRLSIGDRNPSTSVRVHKISGFLQGGSTRITPFENITDVAVGNAGEICVLDGRSVLIINYDGHLTSVINLASLMVDVPPEVLTEVMHGGKDLFHPYAIAVEPSHGLIIISDMKNRYVSAFALSGGGFIRCLVNLKDQVENGEIRAYGVAVNGADQLFLVLRAEGLAETAIYHM